MSVWRSSPRNVRRIARPLAPAPLASSAAKVLATLPKGLEPAALHPIQSDLMADQAARVLFTSQVSVASVIEGLLRQATTSVDAALYRLTNPQLTKALESAHRRGLRVRLLTDQGKFEATQATRDLLSDTAIPYRTLMGLKGGGGKLHHKFAILDRRIVLAGSYNWTLESEEENYDHLLVLQEPQLAAAYLEEFERLWTAAQQLASA